MASLNGYGKIKDEEERIQGIRGSEVDDIEGDSEHVPLQRTRSR